MDDSDDEFPIKRRGKRRVKVAAEPCVPKGDEGDESPVRRGKPRLQVKRAPAAPAAPADPEPRRGRLRRQEVQKAAVEEEEKDDSAAEELAESMLRSEVPRSLPTRLRISRPDRRESVRKSAAVEEEEEEDEPADEELAQSMLRSGVSTSLPTRLTRSKCQSRATPRTAVEEEEEEDDPADEELAQSMLRSGVSTSLPTRLTRSKCQSRATPRAAVEEEEEEDDPADEELAESMLRSGVSTSLPTRLTRSKCQSRATPRTAVEEEEEDDPADEELAESMLRSGVSTSLPTRLTRSKCQSRATPRAAVEEEEEDDPADEDGAPKAMALEELADSMLKSVSSSKPKKSRLQTQSRRRKAERVVKEIIYAEEVPWPAPKKPRRGDDDEDSEVERALRQEELLQRMRNSVEKGRLRMQQSSTDVDVRAIKEAALAPRLSFDWPDSQEHEGEECILEVLPPEEVDPRQLLKEQLDYQRRRELAKGLVVAN